MREKLIETLKYCANPEADCAKCDRWSLDIESKCVEDLLLSAAIALEEKQATSDENKRWIPVTERLPNGRGFVLVFTADRVVGEAIMEENGLFYWANTDEDAEPLFVTHWMPLPEPPKGE